MGFYSAFIVADRVEVLLAQGRRPRRGRRALGIRARDGEFTVETVTSAERGTTVTLHLKDDAKDSPTPSGCAR